MTENRCDTFRHSIGYTRPEYVVCHVDGDLPRVKESEFSRGSLDGEPGSDAKEREQCSKG